MVEPSAFFCTPPPFPLEDDPPDFCAGMSHVSMSTHATSWTQKSKLQLTG